MDAATITPGFERDAQRRSMQRMVGPIWRTVKLESETQNPGYAKHWAVGGSISLLYVECGHTYPRKMSAGVPKKSRCKDCERLRAGMVSTQDNGDGTETETTWCAETNLPRRVNRPNIAIDRPCKVEREDRP